MEKNQILWKLRWKLTELRMNKKWEKKIPKGEDGLWGCGLYQEHLELLVFPALYVINLISLCAQSFQPTPETVLQREEWAERGGLVQDSTQLSTMFLAHCHVLKKSKVKDLVLICKRPPSGLSWWSSGWDLALSLPGPWVWSPIGQLRSHKPCCSAQKLKTKKKTTMKRWSWSQVNETQTNAIIEVCTQWDGCTAEGAILPAGTRGGCRKQLPVTRGHEQQVSSWVREGEECI